MLNYLKRGSVVLIILVLFLPSINSQIQMYEGGGFGGPFQFKESTISEISEKYVYLTENNNLFALHKDGELAWRYIDEGTILGIKIYQDINNDGTKDLFIYSKSIISPSTKLIDGKDGNLIQILPTSHKSYKNIFPTITTDSIIYNNQLIFSNFMDIYSIEGFNYGKKKTILNFINDLDTFGNMLVINSKEVIYFLDSGFNIIKEIKPYEGGYNEVKFFRDSYFILPSQEYDENLGYDVLNSNFNKISTFISSTIPISSIIDITDDKIITVSNEELKIFDIEGNIISKENYVKSYKVLDNSKILLLQNNSIIEMNVNNQIKNIKIPELNINFKNPKILTENLILDKENNLISIYKGNKTITNLDLNSETKSINLGENDLIIDNAFPFSYRYKSINGKLDSEHLKSKTIHSLEEVQDIDSNGYNDVLISFSSASSPVSSLVILYINKNQYSEINFIPTKEELEGLIKNLSSDITNTNNTINQKHNDIDNINNKINEKYGRINELNIITEQTPEQLSEITELEREGEQLEKQRQDINEEIENLYPKLNEQRMEFKSLTNENLEQVNSIFYYSILDNKAISVLLSNRNLYKVDISSGDKTKIFLEWYGFEAIDSAGDINVDGSGDIFFITGNKLGVLNGKTFDISWEKNLTSFPQVGMGEMKFILDKKYAIILEEDKLKVYDIKNGNIITEKPGKFNYIKKLKENFIFSLDEKFIILNKDLSIIEFPIRLDRERIKKGMYLYDCNKDGKDDLLSCSTSITTCFSFSGEKIKEYFIQPQMKQQIIEMNRMKTSSMGRPQEFQGGPITPCKIKKQYLILTTNPYEGASALYSLPLMNNIIFNLDEEKLESFSISEPFLVNGEFQNKKGKIENTQIISSPPSGYVSNGDFKLNFITNEPKMIYVDFPFYTYNSKSEELMKLSSGNHQVSVIQFDKKSLVYYIDIIDTNIKRKKSIIGFLFPIIILIIIILSIIKWKKLKR